MCDKSTPEPACGTAVVTVQVHNIVTANDDIVATNQNTPTTTDVLANDTVTPGGAPLDPASVTVTTPPTHGTTTVNPDGTIEYTPTAGYTGPDSYVYSVCDTTTPTPICDTATVDLTVAPNVVVADPDTGTAMPGDPVTIPVLGNDTTSGQPLNPGSVTITVAPAHGTATVDPTTGAITYTPAVGFGGTDTLTYHVCDTSTPTPICADAVVSVNVPNVVKANDDHVGVAQGNPIKITVLRNDTVSANGAPLDPTSVTIIGAPGHGSVTVNPDGTVVYTPVQGFTGNDTFTYQVCDTSTPTPVCSTATVTVTVDKTGLSIVKHQSVTDTNGDHVTSVGDKISYTFNVTNIGVTIIDGILVHDPTGGSVTCPSTSLAAGTSMVCTADHPHVITAADAKAGGVTNTATVAGAPTCTGPMPTSGSDVTALVSGLRRAAAAASGSSPCPAVITSPPSKVVTPVTVDAALSITKTGTFIDENHDGGSNVGDAVNWTITVTNPGRTAVSDIVVSDPTGGTVTCLATSLAPGVSMVCTVADHVLTAADVSSRTVANTADVTGTSPKGRVQSPAVTATVTLPPAIAVAPPVAPAPPGELSYTGVEIWPQLWAGLLSLLAGVGLIVIGSRRRNSSRRRIG